MRTQEISKAHLQTATQELLCAVGFPHGITD
ncbi:MAG: hypothetical protein EZS28_016145, partial [Streblomastix strix]